MTQTFQAIRITSGNLLFPDKIIISDDYVTIYKNKLIGSKKSVINRASIGSITINTSIFATIVIETKGGERYESNGFSRSAAHKIQEILLVK